MALDPEQTKNEEEKKLLSGLGVAKVLSSLSALGFGVTKTVLSALAGDITGVTENVATASMVIANASGLSFALNKIRTKINESKFAKSKVGKVLIGASGAVWDVATSRPVKLGLKIAGLALAAASTATPAGWALLGLSAGFMTYKVVTGCLDEGKTKRLGQEAIDLQNKTQPLTPETIGAVRANPVLNQFLSDKLNPANFDKSKTREGFGSSVVKTLVGNTIETAGLILETIESGNIAALAASGVSVAGNVSEEAKDAIDRKEKQNRHLKEIEEAKLKIVTAELLQEPGILDCQDPGELKSKFEKIYNTRFPKKTTKARVRNFFGDIGRGAGRFFTQGLPKLSLSKSRDNEAAQHNISAPFLPQQEIDVTRQVSAAAKQEAEQNRKGLEATGSTKSTDITHPSDVTLNVGDSPPQPRTLTSGAKLPPIKTRARAYTR